MGGKGSNLDSTEVGGSEVGAGEGHRRSTKKGLEKVWSVRGGRGRGRLNWGMVSE